MNYFSLFRMPEQFQVDSAALSQAYQTLAQLTHPDKFATAGEREKRLAVQKNAQVNDGYQVLKTPVLRAEHMLELRGVELKHEQQTMQDTGFLMQQMEWREALEDIQASRNEDALFEIDDEIKSHIKVHLNVLEAELGKQHAESDKIAAEEVRKLKFMYKLRNEIETIEDALSDI